MSVYKPKNSPYWHFDFKFKGVRFHGSTGTANKASARVIEGPERTKAATVGGRKERQPMTLNAACGRYYAEIAKHQPSKDTTDYQLANLIKAFGAETLLADITDNEIAEMISRRRADVSNSSVNRETQLLKRVFRRAVKVWNAEIGDMPNWRDQMLPEPAGRVRELTDDEEVRLFAELRPDFHPLIELALATGLRLSNARTLTWAQIDYGTREITVRLKSKRPGGKPHSVPITDKIVALVAQQRGQHPIYVFTYECKRSRGQRRKGERYPFSRSGWRRDWTKALKAAGIADFKFHDLRHTAATRTARVSGLNVAQEQLGHADIASTARYAHATKNDVRAAMEAVQSRNSPEVANGVLANPLMRRA